MLAQKRVLSIRDVLALVESGQPQLRAYREQLAAARYNVNLAKNTLVPDLTAGYQAGYATDNNITGMSYPGLLMPISGPVFAGNSYSLVPGTALTAYLQWTPLTFGQRAAAVERATAQFKVAGSYYDNALFGQRYAAILVYLDLVYLQRILASQQANMDRTAAGLRQSLALAKEGLRPGLDSVQFQSLFAQAMMEFLNTQRQFQSQALELCRLTGLPGTPDELVFSDTLMAAQLPLLPDTSGGYAQNPGYLYQQAQMAVSAANLKEADRAWRPKLDLWANAYSRGSGIGPDGTINKADGWTLSRNNYGAGIQLSFPILQFTRVKIEKRKFGALLLADQEELSQVSMNLERQVETAQSNYRRNLQIAGQAPVLSRAARLSYEGLELSYQNGLVDFTRLTQGQYQLLNAEVMEAGAFLQVWRSLLDIGVATGNLNVFTDQLK
ncbi:MAG: TolC family protein [Bacteroidota bacterium]|nr:TolC family protein [Bacteroidota bacterium]MDP4215231.1 TolC family protein [Bacteroidota bacterium]MDP4247283.1 TolC family protein [Bacteroidota bacterium]MDP4252365.1 TolC family protein [Bacteroidota bacterium]MDP4257922.1 TolC family protein [Bacteroidota bacterium]